MMTKLGWLMNSSAVYEKVLEMKMLRRNVEKKWVG